MKTPQKGQLPLPADLDEASLNFAPSRVEDLNQVVPEGAPRLSTPQEHPKVSPTHCVMGRPHRPSAPFMHACYGWTVPSRFQRVGFTTTLLHQAMM